MIKRRDSVVNIDVKSSYTDLIVQPIQKKQQKEEIAVEEDHKFFEKYINQSQAAGGVSNNEAPERRQDHRQAEVTDFFKNLLQGGSTGRRETTVGRTQEESQRLRNAEQELLRHTSQVIEKKKEDQEWCPHIYMPLYQHYHTITSNESTISSPPAPLLPQ